MFVPIKTCQRSGLYYDQYQYAGRFQLESASCLRGEPQHNVGLAFDLMLERRAYWTTNPNPLIPGARSALVDLQTKLLAWTQPHKRVVSYDRVALYTNDLVGLEHVMNTAYINYPVISHAQVTLPQDVILLKNPTHKYRTYFKARMLQPAPAAAFVKFLKSRQDCFEYTPTLEYRLQHHRPGLLFYTHYNQFVDHDSLGESLMLSIVCSGIVRKTMCIQAK
jgi:hypothetical protein